MTCGCAMSGGMWGWFMGPLGLVVMVAFWALVIWGGVLLFRHLSENGRGGVGIGSAERELSRRFAAGEIDEDEYRHRLDVLHSDAGEHRSGAPR